MEIVLASASPRRSELLQQLRIPHRIIPVEIDEALREQEPVQTYVERLAKAKALEAAGKLTADDIIIGADTVVVLDNEIIGKPCSQSNARDILSKLSGRQHRVITGVCVARGTQLQYECVQSLVRFRTITNSEAEHYWRTGEPADKAGAYAIQGIAAVFIENIQGSYSAIVGLPLFETARMLEDAGYPILHPLTETMNYE